MDKLKLAVKTQNFAIVMLLAFLIYCLIELIL